MELKQGVEGTERRQRPVRVFIDPGSYHCANVGAAMLQVAVERVHEKWPGAEVRVLMGDADGLRNLAPAALPIDVMGAEAWFADRTLLGSLDRYAGDAVAKRAAAWSRRLRERRPRWFRRLLRIRLAHRPGVLQGIDQFLRAITTADLVLISGLGGMRTTELSTLETLRLGIALGKATAMVGLGIAPGQAEEVVEKARQVLSGVDCFGVREGNTSVRFLNKVGVPSGNVVVTGDDAIELAYRCRRPALGELLGVNLRIQPSSGVAWSEVQELKEAVQGAGRDLGAGLLGLPGARDVPDVEVLRAILDGYQGKAQFVEQVETPSQIVQEVAKCRTVVTGAYHVAVFALSQGIPSVCVAKSEYFLDKLQGLAAQFGPGCDVIDLNQPGWGERINSAIHAQWAGAEAGRAHLLKRAHDQVTLSRGIYDRLDKILAARRPASGSPLPF